MAFLTAKQYYGGPFDSHHTLHVQQPGSHKRNLSEVVRGMS